MSRIFARTFALVILGLTAAIVAASQSMPAHADIAGNWLAKTGRLAFVELGEDRYEGSYRGPGKVRLLGKLQDIVFEGHWTAPVAPRECAEARDGGHFWGRVRLEFTPDFNKFSGHWTYCNESHLSGNWLGRREGQEGKGGEGALPEDAAAALRGGRDVATGRCAGDGRVVLAVHGGAVSSRGGNHRHKIAFISQLLTDGHQILEAGAGSLDVVEAAIRMMEDSGIFNAGRGAIANRAGSVELDASIMEGRLRRAGAVAAVRNIKNPISAARLVMEESRHVLMVGPEADAFISGVGGASVGQNYFLKSGDNFSDVPLPADLQIEPPDDSSPPELAAFSGVWKGQWNGVLNQVLAVERITPAGAEVVDGLGTHPEWGFVFGTWTRLPARFEDGTLSYRFLNGEEQIFSYTHKGEGTIEAFYENRTTGYSTKTMLKRVPEKKASGDHGTVGAVALDRCGDLAAGTSTGGYGSKTPGRVGDSPIIGAGTYADNGTAAVSATGHGEYFIRFAVAHEVTAMMRYKGVSVEEAATRLIKYELPKTGLSGGIIALDRDGNLSMPFNTVGMVRGGIGDDLPLFVEVY